MLLHLVGYQCVMMDAFRGLMKSGKWNSFSLFDSLNGVGAGLLRDVDCR